VRRLHVVAPHEKFVASGAYRYQIGDAPTGLLEQWSIHEVGGGALFIRIDLDGRDAQADSVLMEALLNPDGQLERVDQHSYTPGATTPHKLRHVFYVDRVELSGTVGRETHVVEVNIAENAGIAAPGCLLTGLMAARSLACGCPLTLVSADVQDQAFNWTTRQTAAQPLDTATIIIAGRPIVARRVAWQSGTYWLDNYGIALRAETSESAVVMKHYARRPEINNT
jgi:hypothetical protein